MKLANLFLITALVGVVAVIGCDDNPPPQNGNGGNGGTAGSGGSAGSGGTDACSGENCDDMMAVNKTACDSLFSSCTESGDYTEAECNDLAEFICETDLSGAGGAGGTGGVPGGAEVCEECANETAKQLCADTFDDCLNLDLGGNEVEKCKTIALSACII